MCDGWIRAREMSTFGFCLPGDRLLYHNLLDFCLPSFGLSSLIKVYISFVHKILLCREKKFSRLKYTFFSLQNFDLPNLSTQCLSNKFCSLFLYTFFENSMYTRYYRLMSTRFSSTKF